MSPTARTPATGVVATCGTPEPGAEQVAAATARFHAAAQVVEHALGENDYLVADRFGVADVLVGSVLAWADDVGLVDTTTPRWRGI